VNTSLRAMQLSDSEVHCRDPTATVRQQPLYPAHFNHPRVRSHHTMSWLLCGFSELLLLQNTHTYIH